MPGAARVASNISSLAMKPNSGGIPASDSAATQAVMKVIGISVRRPPIFVMSLVPVS
jgi:hypothetical protein